MDNEVRARISIVLTSMGPILDNSELIAMNAIPGAPETWPNNQGIQIRGVKWHCTAT